MMLGGSVQLWYDESIPLEKMYRGNMQSSLCKFSGHCLQEPKITIIYTMVVLQFWVIQRCVIECPKHIQVKFLRTKYNKVGILNCVTYSRIIYHAYYFKHHN